MALTAQIALSILAHETSSGDLSRTLRATPANYAIRLTDGTGANQAQVVWSDARTATTSNDDLTLWSLADTRDGAAVTVAVTQIKLVYVKNTSTTQDLRIGGVSGLDAFAGLPINLSLTLSPGGCYLFSAPTDNGVSVTASASASAARFSAASGSCTYEVLFIGEGTVT
jgi:hypothetical protein